MEAINRQNYMDKIERYHAQQDTQHVVRQREILMTDWG